MSTELSPARELEDVRILLVEDLEDNKILFVKMLESRGARVATASDGVVGLEMALTQDFDLILMDIEMPRMNGYEATAILRTSGYKKPILALTANECGRGRTLSPRSGFDDYLLKPIDRARLVRAISRATGRLVNINFG